MSHLLTAFSVLPMVIPAEKKVMNGADEKEKETDIYRDTPVRLLGYCNEVGEAFRQHVSQKVVLGSYVASIAYVIADTFDKSQKAGKKDHNEAVERRNHVLKTAVDTLVWQGLASVAIPGFTINRIVKLSDMMLKSRIPGAKRGWICTAIGLGSIPLIVLPIDHGTHLFMDNTFRPICGIPKHADSRSH